MHGVKSARLPTWDGQVKTFHSWWTRFQAYAMVNKSKPALKIGGESILPTSEAEAALLTESDEAEKKKLVAVK